MGYESKVFIMERYEYNNVPNPHVSAIKVAEFDLCKMGNHLNQEFYDAFKREIDYTIYEIRADDNGNEVGTFIDTDCYGEHMKSADIGELIAALKVCEAREHYRRIPPLIAMLEAFDLKEWNSENRRLEVIHFGH